MARRSSSSLFGDVVFSLAALVALAMAMNATLVWKVVQEREGKLRGGLAVELSQLISLRVAQIAEGKGPPEPQQANDFADAMQGAWQPSGTPFFAVLVTPSLLPVFETGVRPEVLDGEELAPWLLNAVDLRAALAGGGIERGEWRPGLHAILGDSYAVASSPVLVQGRVVGGVRVAVPIGSPLLGPPDQPLGWVLIASIVLSALILFAFGFFFLRRRILHPLGTLVGGTKELAQGRFDVRIPPGPANELGELGRVFNEMAGALENYRSANEAQMDELRSINADLRQAREELLFAEKMATVGRLAAGVAHEVGNPLAAVIGFVELLSQSADDQELSSDLLQRIRRELERINLIIRDLLSYAHPTGTTESEEGFASSVVVAEVAENAAQLVQVQPRFSGVVVRLELDEDLPEVQVQRGRLQQVFLNLFVNSAEAMGGQGTITLVCEGPPTDDYVLLRVDDDGPGVNPKDRSSIFEPFFTTKDVGQGTGLGLSVSLRLLERMGGSLRLRSSNSGASFVLRLPIAKGAEGLVHA